MNPLDIQLRITLWTSNFVSLKANIHFKCHAFWHHKKSHFIQTSHSLSFNNKQSITKLYKRQWLRKIKATVLDPLCGHDLDPILPGRRTLRRARSVHQTWCWWCRLPSSGAWTGCWMFRPDSPRCQYRCRCRWGCGCDRWPYHHRPGRHPHKLQSPYWQEQLYSPDHLFEYRKQKFDVMSS